MQITAVILSAAPVFKEIEGIKVLNHVSRFSEAEGLLEQRLLSIQKVQTPWFFFLDDTDELPYNHLEVLGECMQAGTPLAYTNEMVSGVLRRYLPYSQALHLKEPLLVHHLVLCDTHAALRAARVIPRGCYALEPLLYFQMAKQGATWIDKVGYYWNRKPGGLSYHPSLIRGVEAASAWAHRHTD